MKDWVVIYRLENGDEGEFTVVADSRANAFDLFLDYVNSNKLEVIFAQAYQIYKKDEEY